MLVMNTCHLSICSIYCFLFFSLYFIKSSKLIPWLLSVYFIHSITTVYYWTILHVLNRTRVTMVSICCHQIDKISEMKFSSCLNFSAVHHTIDKLTVLGFLNTIFYSFCWYKRCFKKNKKQWVNGCNLPREVPMGHACVVALAAHVVRYFVLLY